MKKISGRLFPVMAVLALILILSGVGFGDTFQDQTSQTRNFLVKAVLLSPVKHDNLSIIPIVAPVGGDTPGMVSLDTAINNGSLEVKEVSQSGSVNTLTVSNKGKSPVFIMAGEILKGSKQDRVLKKDVIVPAQCRGMAVDVFCVEHGRWSYKSDKFYSGKQTANISVRQNAVSYQDQSVVWDSVAKTNEKFRTEASGSLSTSYESKEVQDNQDKYRAGFRDILSKNPKANGVIVMINGRVLVADAFADRGMLKTHWDKLLDSYILEAISQKGEKVDSEFTSAGGFMKMIGSAKLIFSTYEGLGNLTDVSSDKMAGSGVYYQVPVHMAVFPRAVQIQRKDVEFRRNYNNQVQQQQINAPVDIRSLPR